MGIFPSLIVGAFICIANEVLWIREGEGEQKDYILGDRKITFLKKERLHFWRQKYFIFGDRKITLLGTDRLHFVDKKINFLKTEKLLF